jgi:hypothetical protein
MVAALHQHLHAADREQLLDLAEDLLVGEDVALGIAGKRSNAQNVQRATQTLVGLMLRSMM